MSINKKRVDVKHAYRMINHGCVVLLTSSYKGRDNVMTLAWHMPVSMKPPLVAVAVSKGHFTSELISKGGEFAINVPTSDLIEKVHYCGRISGRDTDKFDSVRLTREKGSYVQAPLVGECVGHIECGLVDRHDAGDHYVFIGEVAAASAAEDTFDGKWRFEPEGLVTLHHMGENLYAETGRRLFA